MNAADYKTRRQKLLDLTGTGYAISAFHAMQQTNDSAGPFIQDANFYYLTGITEPSWKLIVDSDGNETLVAPDISETHRIFDGGLSDQQATQISGVMHVVTKSQGVEIIDELLKENQSFGVVGADPHEDYNSFIANPALKELLERVEAAAVKVVDVRPLLAKLRGRKDEGEVARIRRAVDVTVEAFGHVKSSLQKLTHEYNIEAEFSYAFRNQGLTHAYEPIVAAGVNACTLHYQANSMRLPENGLVLLDIGARFDGYAADITRTYAVGTPSAREVAVHKAVEKAHHQIIDRIRPGLDVKKYHEQVDEIMQTALTSLDLLKSKDDYRKYFPHAVSHGLGIDVHDPLGAPKTFEAGMVLTVEPGIYIPEEGIGVRIEDDILVTETGHENLSAALPTSL